jgi:alanyl-tRNA synthetase
MTDRLYYTDPYLRAFDATVARAERRDGRLVVTLDRTAFYPTSGGQPFDTGRLGPLRVVDVIDDEDGSIAHVVEPGTPNLEPRTNPEPGTLNLEPGQRVHGEIDWGRRFDHMQQHSGQHVLSAAFDKLFGVRTVSFHLGAVASTIDLAREMSPAEIAAAESEANRIVWEDRPVAIRFADAEEAARLPLRKEPAREGRLRLIDVEDFDLSACGGTHVARTGGIGVIAVASWERFKGGQRLEFLCGGRALGAYRTLRDAMAASVRLLSVLPEELPAGIERLQSEAREQKRSIVALQNDLAAFRADELATEAETVALKPGATVAAGATCRLVARALDADANGLKTLATNVTARPGYLVVLVSSSSPALIVIAKSSDVTISAQQLLAELMAEFGGRGGGRSEIAQGGGLAASADAILAAARAAI